MGTQIDPHRNINTFTLRLPLLLIQRVGRVAVSMNRVTGFYHVARWKRGFLREIPGNFEKTKCKIGNSTKGHCDRIAFNL